MIYWLKIPLKYKINNPIALIIIPQNHCENILLSLKNNLKNINCFPKIKIKSPIAIIITPIILKLSFKLTPPLEYINNLNLSHEL